MTIDPPPGTPDGPTRSLARRRLAAALRRVHTVVVGRPVTTADLLSAAEAAESMADALEAAAQPGKAPRAIPDPARPVEEFFPTSPYIGFENPISPPARIWTVAGADGTPEVRGTVRFGYPFEGPPTCVHGGSLASLCDELLGASLLAARRPGLTGTLTVRYRRPTPLQADLDLEARATTVERRKVRAWAGIFLAGELCAEAEGIFIPVGTARMAGIVAANAEEASAEVVDDQLRAIIARGGEIFAGD